MNVINTLPTMISTKDKYFIYVRKSTRPTDRQVESIPSQIKTLNEFSKSHGYNVIQTFAESQSAYTDNVRDVFDSMLQSAIQRNDIKGILFRYIDRASRNLIEGGELYKLVETGVIDEIVTPEAVFNKSNFFYYGIEILKAKSYSDDISKKVRDSFKTRVEKGIAPFSPMAGYMWDPNAVKGQKTVIANPIQFPLMKELFGIFLIGDHSVNKILQIAKDMGIKNSLGNPISRCRMYEILKSPYYCGKFIYKDKEYQGTHPRMITDDQHRAILQILNRLSKPTGMKRDFLLNGIIKCEDCGMSFYGEQHIKHYKNGKTQVFRYYRCSKRGKIKCNQPYVTERDLELNVENYLENLQVGSDYIVWTHKWPRKMKSEEITNRESSLKLLSIDLSQINIKIDKIMDEKLSGTTIFDTEELEDKYRKLKIQRKEIEEAIKNVGANSDIVNEMTLKTFVFADSAKKLFENGTAEEKRNVLLAVGTNLLIKDKNIKIQPQIPFLLIEKAVNALRTQKGVYEPDQTITFDLGPSTPLSDKFAKRALYKKIRTQFQTQ